jgi:hypothetical protein
MKKKLDLENTKMQDLFVAFIQSIKKSAHEELF